MSRISRRLAEAVARSGEAAFRRPDLSRSRQLLREAVLLVESAGASFKATDYTNVESKMRAAVSALMELEDELGR